MNQLQITNRRYQVPDTWDELSRLQLLGLLRELGQRERPYLRLRLLAVLLGESVATLRHTIAPVALVQLLGLADFVFDEQARLTAQRLPVLRLPWWRDPLRRAWVGPRAHFRTLLFGEFIFADTYFVHHARTGRPELLDKFLAVLYRPRQRGASPRRPDYAGDARQPFNEHRLDYHARQLRHVSAAEKEAVLIWYRGCRSQLVEEFPEVFTPSREAQAAKSDWGRVLRKLSGGAFGALEQTARQDTRTILAEIQDKMADYEQAKEAARRTQP